jgi:hypothetical protein
MIKHNLQNAVSCQLFYVQYMEAVSLVAVHTVWTVLRV